MIRERVEVAAPVADSTSLLAGGNTWSFPTGGEFSLRLGSAPGAPYASFATSFQCGPVSSASLTLKFKGSREGETFTLPLGGRRVGEYVTYYPECPGGADGFGPFHIVSYGRETIPLGALAAGDVIKVTYRANGLAIQLRYGSEFDLAHEVVPGGVREVGGEAWTPVGQLYASFDTFFGRLAVPLPFTADPDTLTEAGGAARLALGDTRIDGDSLVTFRVADTAWGGLRRDDGTTGAPLASVTVDADEARSGVLFVAGETLPESVTAVAVSASALGRDGALTFFVGPPVVSLTLTAERDSLAAGEDTAFTLDAENVDDDATITLSISDASLGGLVVGGGPALGRSGSASVQVVLAQVPSVRFVAADPAPEAEAVVTITAESEDGTTATAEITLLPPATVQWLAVTNAPYGLDYLMVSRFPTDQRMPIRDAFVNPDFNQSPSRDLPTAILAGANAGDLFTVRASLNAAASFGANVRCQDVRFRLRVLRDGVPVTFRQGDGQPVGQAYYEYPAVSGSNASGECRAKRYVRFVSNARPGSAGIYGSQGTPNPGGGVYDDEYRKEQTVRVEVGDLVEIWAVAMVNGAPEESAPLPLPIGREGAPLTESDAQAAVFVHWSTMPNGSTAAPYVVTSRASEDLAQAAVQLRYTSATTYREVQNAISLSGPSGSNPHTWTPTAPGTVGVTIVIEGPNNGPDVSITGECIYTSSDNLDAIAGCLMSDLAAMSMGTSQEIDATVNAWSRFSDDAQGVWVMLVARGYAIRSVTPTPPASEVVVDAFNIDYSQIVDQMSMMVAMNARDGDPTTLDVIEVPANSLYGRTIADPLSGAAFGYGDSAEYPDLWGNTVLLDRKAADPADDLPHVAGHEIAHVLLNGPYTGASTSPACRQANQHDDSPTNLVACMTSLPAEGYGTQKRLTQQQADDIHVDHAPTTAPSARLLRPFDTAQRHASTLP